ncbi:hypothetical protein OUZ56_026894 [Daphnia magna]|uniref:Uncharacterized protein n=1 Tax=Daphnia magna TaxID=35525 RepID=A0ABQ9ZN51_9CRUS|nr:hypothetical protein OUZ56_026894 [Daphnia magna]
MGVVDCQKRSLFGHRTKPTHLMVVITLTDQLLTQRERERERRDLTQISKTTVLLYNWCLATTTFVFQQQLT